MAANQQFCANIKKHKRIQSFENRQHRTEEINMIRTKEREQIKIHLVEHIQTNIDNQFIKHTNAYLLIYRVQY